MFLQKTKTVMLFILKLMIEKMLPLIATLVSQYKPFVQIESVGPINIKLKRNDQKQGE